MPLRAERAQTKRSPWPLFAACAGAILLAVLFWFGQALMSGRGASLDRAIILSLRTAGHPDQPLGPEWLPSAVRDVTALGSSTVLTMVTVAAGCLLALRRRWRTAFMMIAATAGGALAVTLMKSLIARARPDLVQHLMAESSHSFPSGHAANSAIVYLSLASLLFPIVSERRVRTYILAVALSLVVLIGVSRVYLGVHWPSDVLAGWCFGTIWALIWWRIQVGQQGSAADRAIR